MQYVSHKTRIDSVLNSLNVAAIRPMYHVLSSIKPLLQSVLISFSNY